MDTSNGLVLCSVMLKPVRQNILDSLITWLDIISIVPNHTFVVEEACVPLNKSNPSGYWYCAGDFCDIDEPGVHQYLDDADIKLARCLVTPSIKDDHELRPVLVIGGEYSVNYVCHNITNRILYATDGHKTLGDVDIPKNGYSVVIKSALGVYGQNKLEWKRRKENCSLSDDSVRTRKAKVDMWFNDQDLEIEKVHLSACRGDEEMASRLTDELASVDGEFLVRTKYAVESYEEEKVEFKTYTQLMVNACSFLFSETIKIVGRQKAQKIYSGCNIDIESSEIKQKDKPCIMAI